MTEYEYKQGHEYEDYEEEMSTLFDHIGKCAYEYAMIMSNPDAAVAQADKLASLNNGILEGVVKWYNGVVFEPADDDGEDDSEDAAADDSEPVADEQPLPEQNTTV
jgi:hypothetical protein